MFLLSGRRHQKSYVVALLTMSWELREKEWFTALNAGLTMRRAPASASIVALLFTVQEVSAGLMRGMYGMSGGTAVTEGAVPS
jgi:hypothetical protein